MSEKETDILARTIYGEARGESISGMEAVASVVLNRVAFAKRRGRFWWGNSIAEVCRAPKQFSCWNRNDPNYRLICKRIAGRAVAGLLEDKTNGATHYHTRHVWPDWAKGKIPCAEIGRHFFYNDIEK